VQAQSIDSTQSLETSSTLEEQVATKTNPALVHLAQSQSVLLMQGPVGPLLTKLALKLVSKKKLVHRVVFNGGDRQSARGHPNHLLHAFNWPMETLPHWFKSLCLRHRVDTVVLFGQSRPCHAAVIPVAKAMGIKVVVMEEGYFRPGFMTMELDGVNGNSQTLDRFECDPAVINAPTPDPDVCKHHFFKTAVHAMRYYWAMAWRRRAFPHYVHHRETSVIWYARYWVNSWFTKWARYQKDHELHQILVKFGPPYFLVPLQHDGDAQITEHSGYDNNQHFIEEVIRSFATHSNSGHVLLFKEHPMSRGGQLSQAWIERCALERGVELRVKYVVEGHNPTLILQAQGVVVINSTMGLQAIQKHKPVKPVGQSLYDRPGVTFQGSLDEFWKTPTAPDPAVTDEFLSRLKHLTQVPCSVYANADEPWQALSSL
jgi:capsular polysaccharide export protein